MKNISAAFLFIFVAVAYGLQVDNVVVPGRSVNGNIVSDYDQDPETPIFGAVQNSGSGTHTIVWAEVAVDGSGNPITILNYELRYRIVGQTEYNFVSVPGEFTGHALTLSAGDYEGNVVAVSDSGLIGPASNFTFTVN